MRFSTMRLQRRKKAHEQTNSKSWIWGSCFYSPLSLVNDKLNIYHLLAFYGAKSLFLFNGLHQCLQNTSWSRNESESESENEMKGIEAMISSVLLVPLLSKFNWPEERKTVIKLRSVIIDDLQKWTLGHWGLDSENSPLIVVMYFCVYIYFYWKNTLRIIWTWNYYTLTENLQMTEKLAQLVLMSVLFHLCHMDVCCPSSVLFFIYFFSH